MERLFDIGQLRELQPCKLPFVSSNSGWTVAGLFAGIGGIELGLSQAGFETQLLCECWEPAQYVLRTRFPDVSIYSDVRELEKLPTVDLVTAVFPCTDLSQAGRTKGITGEASGLVGEVFRLLDGKRVPWLVLENVRNMLVLERGRAMRFLVDELERLGYQWAYRLVDSRFTGVPQRRQRVLLVASLEGDPAEVLFADETGSLDDPRLQSAAHGFYWTEGLRGLGWAKDAVPTLKGGSTIGIPSPPAIWHPRGRMGRRIVTPRIGEAERLQGFPENWTSPADEVSRRKGVRWKLVGNAVSVGVAAWVGTRLLKPGPPVVDRRALGPDAPWPKAAVGGAGQRWALDASMFPVTLPYQHLPDVVDLDAAVALSHRAASGFLERANRGSLRFQPHFLEDVADHVRRAPAAA
jgi:DNA (cytosine-5)-methyltransferase 1